MCNADTLSRDKISLEKLALASRLGSLNVALGNVFYRGVNRPIVFIFSRVKKKKRGEGQRDR